MRKLAAFLIAVFTATQANAVIAADMRTTGLPREAEALADDMAYFMGLSQACRPSDGTILNRAYWEPRIKADVPQGSYALFAKIVRLRSSITLRHMTGPSAPLQCDDALDRVEEKFDSIAEGGPAAEPICWSDVTDTNRCEGVGEDDPLAGVDAILAGY